jgi:hypothetical protein
MAVGMAAYFDGAPVWLEIRWSQNLDGCLLGSEACRQPRGIDRWQTGTGSDLALGEDAPQITVAKASEAVGNLAHCHQVRANAHLNPRVL